MAPLVSPFCSPLSSTSILERAGVPAGKQSRPIAPLPYPKWTNRGPSRRAKMNGSLSPHRLASLWSSLLPMLPTLSLVSFLPLVRSHFTIPRSRASSIPPILFVLLPSPLCVQHRSTLFSPPVQSCSPRCLIPYTVVQPSDVSRDTFTLSFSFSLSRSYFFLSFSVFSLISTLFFLYALFFSFTLPCRSLFFILCFPPSQQFFWWLASHAFIHFFRRFLILLYFYTSRFLRFVSFLFDPLVFLSIVNITSSTIFFNL